MFECVIFLDIDGVLNGSDTKDRMGRICGISDEKISLLKELVGFFAADIVLTSTWRIYWTKELASDGVTNWRGRSEKRYGRYLNLRLAEYGIGISDKTPDIHWSRRSAEIKEWLAGHPETKWFVILDDEDFGWEDDGLESHWIDTKGHGKYSIDCKGLTRDVVDFVISHKEDFFQDFSEVPFSAK